MNIAKGTTMRRLLILSVLLLIVCSPSHRQAGPAYPGPIETTQPDGTTVNIRIFGDEWYHFYENADGYAVVQDSDNWWTYADLDHEGRFIPTIHTLGDENSDAINFRNTKGKHLREYAEEKVNRRELFYQRTMPNIIESVMENRGDERTVSINVPVVLIQYPDFFASQSVSSFSNMMNQINYNGTGSFQDYYFEVSNSNLYITATVVGWYTAPQNRVNYRIGNGTTAEWNMAKILARSAVDAAETAGFNWGPFDNDGNGDVDMVFVVHQGPGAECGSNNHIWSHAWFLNDWVSDLSVTYDGKLIDRYVAVPEENCYGGHEEIGIFCHEFGHTLGLPDLYDIDDSSAGIGFWGLMSSGSWGGNGTTPQTPVHMCAWSKVEQGWITPTVVASNLSNVPIHTGQAYQLWTNGMPGNEYFLVENRQQQGFDSGLYNSGLAIWHIDETMRRTDNTDNQNELRKLVDLEEADGLAQLDASPTNYGDAGDLYPGTTANTVFNGASNPNSNDNSTIATQVSVANISSLGNIMYADLGVTTASGSPNLIVRDCLGDTGAEPLGLCLASFSHSPDIWIDNNDDGITDAPIIGQVNHLYVRAWNAGTPTSAVTVTCYFNDPSLGAIYGMGGPALPIIDTVTGLPYFTLSSMGTAFPAPGGTGYQGYINWFIPPSPSGYAPYSIGCVVENPADPQWSPIPYMDNNLGHCNYGQLSMNLGVIPPNNGDGEREDVIFHQEVRIFNPFEEETELLVRAEVNQPGWEVLPEPEIQFILPPHGEINNPFDIIKHEPTHRDSAEVTFQLYKLPEMELIDVLVNDLAIDDLPPLPVPLESWKVEHFKPLGNNLIRPVPTGRLSWEEPDGDVGGFPERIRFFEVYGSEYEHEVVEQSPAALMDETYSDADPFEPGFQFYIYEDLSVPRYYSVVPVDMAGNRGPLAPILTPEDPLSDIPDTPVATVSQNYPNPFNPQTKIDFTVTHDERVRVVIYDQTGKQVKVLVDQLYDTGTWSVNWDGRDQNGQAVASGIYFVRLNSASLNDVKKMVLVR